MFELDLAHSALLVICLIAACSFEFVNGFHDTANAVATVIYTNSLKPWIAVIWSGVWNFFGIWFLTFGVYLRVHPSRNRGIRGLTYLFSSGFFSSTSTLPG